MKFSVVHGSILFGMIWWRNEPKRQNSLFFAATVHPNTLSQMTTRTPTPIRARTLALRESLERQLIAQTDEFAAPLPPDPPGSGSCRIRKQLCYGRGDDFDRVGRWCGCVSLQYRT
jgi:hypothetical protein